MNVFPVISSILSASHLAKFIAEKYRLSPATSCTLLRTGINHSYIVTDENRKFVFRVYSYNWRFQEEIEEEIRLLNLLKENAISVSYPVSDLSGTYIQQLQAPEGVRYGVLFTFAEGKKVRNFSAETSSRIGVLMAQMHKLTEKLTLKRTHYTPAALTQQSYLLARAHFPDSNDDMVFIKQAGDFFVAEFEKIDKNALRWGSVHLDIWYDNMSIREESQIVLFDFDFCGNGYLFYDIAYFIMQLYHTEPDKQQYQLKLDSFLSAYQSISVITPEEIKYLPLAGLAIWIFYLGVQSQRFDNWSNLFLSENYLQRYMGMAKEWLSYNKIEIRLK